MKDNIEFVFKTKNNLIMPELIMRIFFVFISILNFNTLSRGQLMEHHIYDFFWVAAFINFFLISLTIYFNYRRVETIQRVIEMRIKNIEFFKAANYIYSIEEKNFYRMPLISLQTILFFLSIVIIPFMITNELHISANPSTFILGLVFPIIYFSIFVLFKKIFIDNKLSSIKVEGQELSIEETNLFKDLFQMNSIEKPLYLNDELIIKVSNTANEYKQRVETLLIESVFIGALTFGTFIQLTSPESISSISDIENKEEKINNQIKLSDFSIESLKKELRNTNRINGSLLIDKKKIPQNHIIKPNQNKASFGGYFSNWAINRKFCVLSFYYRGLSDQERYRVLVGEVISDDELKERINTILSDTIRDENTIKKLSSLSARVQLFNEIGGIFNGGEEKIKYYRELIYRANPSGLSKYDSLTKKYWDEQEFIFLIAIGSIICSVFYIAVLIKRYPIIISIEKLIAEINKAKMWNNREESMQAKKLETEIIHMPDEVLTQFDKKINYYTERVQSQLAVCELVASRIETNIKLVSLFRSVGLGIFFIVLLISTLMVDYSVSLFLLIIISYAIFVAEILNENSFIIRLLRLIFKKKKTDNLILD